MTQEQSKAQVWAKPELTKLGTIKDVAGTLTVGNDAGAGFKNKS